MPVYLSVSLSVRHKVWETWFTQLLYKKKADRNFVIIIPIIKAYNQLQNGCFLAGFRLLLYFSHFSQYLWCLWSYFKNFLLKITKSNFLFKKIHGCSTAFYQVFFPTGLMCSLPKIGNQVVLFCIEILRFRQKNFL